MPPSASRSNSAKEFVWSTVQPKTFPPKTRGEMSIPAFASGPWSEVLLFFSAVMGRWVERGCFPVREILTRRRTEEEEEEWAFRFTSAPGSLRPWQCSEACPKEQEHFALRPASHRCLPAFRHHAHGCKRPETRAAVGEKPRGTEGFWTERASRAAPEPRMLRDPLSAGPKSAELMPEPYFLKQRSLSPLFHRFESHPETTPRQYTPRFTPSSLVIHPSKLFASSESRSQPLSNTTGRP